MRAARWGLFLGSPRSVHCSLLPAKLLLLQASSINVATREMIVGGTNLKPDKPEE